MNHLNSNQLKELRHLLMEEQSSYKLHEKLQNNDGLEVSANLSTGELSAYDNHPADVATEIYERSKDMALNRDLELQMDNNQKALSKMNTGRYGICEQCGKPIPFERLQAIPATATCYSHAEQHQQVSDYRPIEEDALANSGLDRSSTDDPSQGREDAWQIVESWGTSTSSPNLDNQEDHEYQGLQIEVDESESF